MAAKDTILAADAFTVGFPFLILGSVTVYNVPECPKLYLRALTRLYKKPCILFFQNNRIFHLSIVGTRQANIRNKMAEKIVSRSDKVTSRYNYSPAIMP